MTAALSRSEKLPAIEDATGDRREDPGQSPDEMLAIVRQLKVALARKFGTKERPAK